jgi:hypothetical protein
MLVHDPPEAVEAGVLVAAIARRADVGQVDLVAGERAG